MLLLLLSGCQDRKVTKLVVVDGALPNELAEDSPYFEDEEPLIEAQITSNTSSQDSIIIAKSKDLAEISERTLILYEIDYLLDVTLGNLEELEEDTLSDDNIIKEGGVK
jgi:hypothetical protein